MASSQAAEIRSRHRTRSCCSDAGDLLPFADRFPDLQIDDRAFQHKPHNGVLVVRRLHQAQIGTNELPAVLGAPSDQIVFVHGGALLSDCCGLGRGGIIAFKSTIAGEERHGIAPCSRRLCAGDRAGCCSATRAGTEPSGVHPVGPCQCRALQARSGPRPTSSFWWHTGPPTISTTSPAANCQGGFAVPVSTLATSATTRS